MRVVLLFGPLVPRLAASAAAHLSGSQTVPWPLVFRLLASAELCSTGQASPAWSSWDPFDLSGLDQGDPLGLLQDVPWALTRNPLVPNYSRDTIIAIMELDWFCIGVLEVSDLCYMKGFCELLSWVSTKALVNIRYLTIYTQSKRVVIISSVTTRIF